MTKADEMINDIISGRGDMSMFMLILQGVVERELKNIDNPTIVELGVRSGHSTLALLNGLFNIKKGRLYSADIDPCEAAHHAVSQAELYNLWYFKQIDSIEFASDFQQCDLLFIDSSHEYQHTLNELQTWSPKIKKNGIIILHDILSTDGVPKAIKDFMKIDKNWIENNINAGPGLGFLVRK